MYKITEYINALAETSGRDKKDIRFFLEKQVQTCLWYVPCEAPLGQQNWHETIDCQKIVRLITAGDIYKDIELLDYDLQQKLVALCEKNSKLIFDLFEYTDWFFNDGKRNINSELLEQQILFEGTSVPFVIKDSRPHFSRMSKDQFHFLKSNCFSLFMVLESLKYICEENLQIHYLEFRYRFDWVKDNYDRIKIAVDSFKYNNPNYDTWTKSLEDIINFIKEKENETNN